jgi:hypothetical protein
MLPGWRLLAVATLVVIVVGTPLNRGLLQSLPIPSAVATSGRDDPTGRAYQGDNDDGDDGDNGDGDNDDGDGDNDDGDNDEDNDDEGDDNDNFDDFDLGSIYDELGIPRPPSLAPRPSISAPSRPPEPTCSTPGRDTVFTSHDGKVALRVFGSTAAPVKIVIYQVINADSAPLPPGTFVRPLVYEVWASDCGANRLTELPAEVNLGIRYNDLEAIGLDEGRFVIGRLDMETAVWVPVEKQANDPPANYVSATIIQAGYYMVWEAQ